ncbi:MAG: hypothetical protein ACE148_06245 [Vicinamibacterales bacterium]
MAETDRTSTLEVHSRASGSHWIAWVTKSGNPSPVKSVIVVGRTREEAEARVRSWAEEASGRGYI